MGHKRALIVDDSKSARTVLSRMLEKYEIEVDMAESAEEALEYLKHNRPDAIFMDHQMPGMDGLQAVQVIKSNTHTAMIPIMMYTSQEGELYVGQARALGAMGVLPKQVRPVDVSKVLYELHLLPDRRDKQEPALQPVEWDFGDSRSGPSRSSPSRPAVPAENAADGAAAGVTPLHAAPSSAALPGAAAPPGTADWGRRVESTVKDQAADLRRYIVANLDNWASRIIIDVRDTLAPLTQAVERTLPPPDSPLPPEPPQRKSFGALLAVGAACIAALAFFALWMSQRMELAQAKGEIASLTAINAEINRARQELSENLRDLTGALAALPAVGGTAVVTPNATVAAVRTESVPYGEVPLDRSRLEALRDLLSKLEQQGFHGVVKITTVAGLYCLSGNPSDGFVPANGNLPFSKCDSVANPFEESASGQQRQSLAFANLIAGIRQRTSGAISITIENAGTSRAPVPYPVRSESLTAGEWNKAAAANNRVEFTVEPNATQ
jgi:CheY-like chemotaxis protein